MRRNRRAQMDFPILGFVVVAIGLIIFAPVMLKVFTSIRTPTSAALSNVSVQAGTNYDAVMTPFINWWDKIVVFVFIISLLLLFISAFLIDTHPIWVILYILICFFVVIFSNNVMKAADNIYDSGDFAVETNQLSFMDFLRNNFFAVLMGIIIITGVIMYGKIALFPSGGGGMR